MAERKQHLFASALAVHGYVRLKAAFERCNQRSGLVPCGRTTFDRWLRGAVPSRGDFVLGLAGVFHLDITCPFPHGHPDFPILFRGYQVRGAARIRLALRSPRARNPRSYAFLGYQRDWGTSSALDELLVEFGDPGRTLGAETGLVLPWSERYSSRPGQETRHRTEDT